MADMRMPWKLHGAPRTQSRLRGKKTIGKQKVTQEANTSLVQRGKWIHSFAKCQVNISLGTSCVPPLLPPTVSLVSRKPALWQPPSLSTGTWGGHDGWHTKCTHPQLSRRGEAAFVWRNIPCWPPDLAVGSSGLQAAALAADHAREWHQQKFSPVLLTGRQ